MAHNIDMEAKYAELEAKYKKVLLENNEMLRQQLQPIMAHNIDIENDAETYFHNHRITFSGINAGEYLDKEDFIKYAKYIAAALQPIEAIEDEDKMWGEVVEIWTDTETYQEFYDNCKHKFTIKRKQ